MSNITNPVGGSTDLVANEAHVRQHLKILTKRWPELDEPVQFEIRCLERDTKFPTWEFFNPDKDMTTEVFEACRAQGIILSKSGPFQQCLRMVPPLCLSLEDVDRVANSLDQALKTASHTPQL